MGLEQIVVPLIPNLLFAGEARRRLGMTLPTLLRDSRQVQLWMPDAPGFQDATVTHLTEAAADADVSCPFRSAEVPDVSMDVLLGLLVVYPVTKAAGNVIHLFSDLSWVTEAVPENAMESEPDKDRVEKRYGLR